MKTAVKILFSLVLGLSGSYYFFFYRCFPKREGKVQIQGLKEPVYVLYDSFGVPHIDAKTPEDAFLSLGYIFAEHRLFQMDIQRKLARGQLSEILGEKTLELDKLNRTLGFSHYGQKFANEKNWSPETEVAVQSFLTGVNLFIDERRFPIEFRILNYEPSPFTSADILAFIGYMSFSFQEAFSLDPVLHSLKASLPSNEFEELIHSYEDNGPSIDKSSSKPIAKHSFPAHPLSLSSSLLTALNQNDIYGFKLEGSNSWVVSGERSQSGLPILANDPHIRHSNPNVWFEAAIKVGSHEIYGHFLPMVPFPVLGKTPHHAWALTMSEIDDMDLFVHRVEGNKIITSTKSYDIKTEKDILSVKNAPPIELDLSYTAYGPILSPLVQSNQGLISGFWPFYHDSNTSLEALHKMYLANDLPSFQEALSFLTTPGLSISYADTDNNIAWFAAGATLNRSKKQSSYEIQESYYNPPPTLNPFSQNPHLINPPDHFIVTANHRVSNANIAKFPGYYQPSDRARRILQMLDSKEKFSVQDFVSYIHDTQDDFWPKVKDLLLKDLDSSNHPLAIDIYPLLKDWDGSANVDSPEMLIYRTWLNWISYYLLVDEIGEDFYPKIYKSPIRYNLTKKLMFLPQSTWWDIKSTDNIETQREVILKAFHKAMEFLNAQVGTDISQWSWGKLHTLELSHPLGKAPPLHLIFNIGPEPVDGAYSIVNANGARTKWDSFSVESGPSTRRIIDMANPRHSLGILPSGQSGHFLDKHYRDQWPLYTQSLLRAENLDFHKGENFITFSPKEE